MVQFLIKIYIAYLYHVLYDDDASTADGAHSNRRMQVLRTHTAHTRASVDQRQRIGVNMPDAGACVCSHKDLL